MKYSTRRLSTGWQAVMRVGKVPFSSMNLWDLKLFLCVAEQCKASKASVLSLAGVLLLFLREAGEVCLCKVKIFTKAKGKMF